MASPAAVALCRCAPLGPSCQNWQRTDKQSGRLQDLEENQVVAAQGKAVHGQHSSVDQPIDDMFNLAVRALRPGEAEGSIAGRGKAGMAARHSGKVRHNGKAGRAR